MIDTLRKIVQKVNEAPDLTGALKLLVKEVKVSMGTEVCSIYLVDSDKERYVLKATEGLKKSSIGKASLAYSEGLVGLVADREEPINLQNASEHPKFQFIEGTGEEKYSAFLGVPIIHQKRMLGILVVQQKKQRSFDSSEEAFLITLSAQLAAVLVHAEATAALEVKPAAAVKKARGGKKSGGKSKVAKFKGVTGSSGVAIATALVVYPKAELDAVPERFISEDETVNEQILIMHALETVRDEIRALREKVADILPVEEQGLFDVYLKILESNALGGEIVDVIKKGQWAQGALKQVVNKHVKAFESMDDPYMSERSIDVKDLGVRLLSCLQAQELPESYYDDDIILVGEEITTSQLLDTPHEKLRGVVSVKGSSNSHMAIIARALNVPTVVGAVELPYAQMNGRELIVDGFQGQVYCDPNQALKKQYQNIIEEEAEILADLEQYRELRAETTDGHVVDLWVNTGLMVDVTRSIDKGAEGVGLYRTEIPFMIRERFPSEDEQVAIYREQLLAASPRVFTMRTIDIGGDKSLPYFPIEEENPFLGWRGIRITLDHPEIFIVQIRAMLRASEGLKNLRILLPMITTVFEVEEAQYLIHRAYHEVVEEGYDIVMPPIGVMVEIPAAAYQARALAQRVEFISVGSNDLTQYLLAVDRNNPRVADLYNSFHPALMNTLYYTVREAKKENIPVGICGEMAGDPRAAVLLMAMGFDSLSMSANSLLRVKYALRNLTMQQCKAMLDEVLVLDSAEVITSYMDLCFEKLALSRIAR